MPNLIDHTGQRFGRLVVEAQAQARKATFVAWHCRCECARELKLSEENELLVAALRPRAVREGEA